MKRYQLRSLKLVVGLAGILSVVLAGAGANLEWTFSEAVQYKENHDPGMIWLMDGRKIKVAFGELSWEHIEQLKAGHKLTITYSPDQGCWLRDDTAKKQIEILDGLPTHPLDTLLRRYLEQHGDTTRSMVAITLAARDQWDKELNRVYQALLASLPKDKRALVVDAQRKWIQFREAELKALGQGIYHRDGTIYQVIFANRAMEVTRERALKLMSYRAD